MKILVITESIPFPPRDGKELPIASIFQRLSERHKVDFLVAKNNDKDFLSRVENIPNSIREVDFLRTTKRSKSVLLLQELLQIRPAFFSDQYDMEKAVSFLKNKQYDIAWVSPVFGFELVRRCRAVGFEIANKIVIGLNDVKTTLYKDSFNELRSGRYGFELGLLTDYLRVPFIRNNERKYIKEADLIHVQTVLEQQRADNVAGEKLGQKVVSAQNGIKEELRRCSYKGIDSNHILYNTNMSGGRSKESEWFLKQVWPNVYKKHPQATLLVAGGPPPKNHWVYKMDGVKVLGFVDNLPDLFDKVAMCVVPIIHSTGLINRVVDGLTAGIPVIGSSNSLKTVAGLELGVHAVGADTAQSFVNEISNLVENKSVRETFAKNSRSLGDELPTWEDTANKIEASLKWIIGK